METVKIVASVKRHQLDTFWDRNVMTLLLFILQCFPSTHRTLNAETPPSIVLVSVDSFLALSVFGLLSTYFLFFKSVNVQEHFFIISH